MKVYIGKTDATAYIGGLSLTTDESTNGEECSFESIELYTIGSQIKITDGKVVQFLGTIIQVEKNTRPPHSYWAIDFSWNLKSEEIIQFKKLRADEAIKKLCKRVGVRCKVCSIPTKISKIYKSNTLSIIKDILTKAQKASGWRYFYEMRGTTLYVEKKKQIKIKPTFLLSDDDAITFDIEDLRNTVRVYRSNQNIYNTRDNSSAKKLGTRVKTLTVGKKVSVAKAKTQAKAQLKKLNKVKGSKTLNLICTSGYWDIRKNRLIYINRGGMKGWYSIKSCTHEIDGGQHRFTLEVEWSSAFK